MGLLCLVSNMKDLFVMLYHSYEILQCELLKRSLKLVLMEWFVCDAIKFLWKFAVCELLKRSLILVFREWIGGNRRHSFSIKMKGFGEKLSTLIWGSLCLQLGLVSVKIIIIIGRICLNSGLDFGVQKNKIKKWLIWLESWTVLWSESNNQGIVGDPMALMVLLRNSDAK